MHHTQCKYGGETPFVARIIFKVCKDVNECMHRKWRSWGLNVMNWAAIVDKMTGIRDMRIVIIDKWNRPPEGYFKINVACDEGVAAIVRDWRGVFCFAVRKGSENASLQSGVSIINEGLFWCASKSRKFVQIELEEGEL